MDADQLPPLSPREQHYLWLVSQGHTPRQAYVAMGCGETPSLCTRIKAKLSARTMEHAVYIAVTADLIGPHRACGTIDGYRDHHSRGETDPCRACRRAFTGYTARHNVAKLQKVTLTHAEIRYLRALDSGRSFKTILANWGVSRRVLDDVRTALYSKLDVAHLPQQSKVRASLEAGRRLGYLRPVQLPDPGKQLLRIEQPPLTELEIRTLALLASGASLREAGLAFDPPLQGSSISSRLARVYQKLDVLHFGHGERREAAVKEARNRGYQV